jgi:hypothetical protein
MKLFSYPVGAIVNGITFRERTIMLAQPVQINEVNHGVDIFDKWSKEELAAIGIKSFEESRPSDEYDFGTPVDIETEFVITRTYPNATISEARVLEKKRQSLIEQIIELENKQTARRVREASLTEDGRNWLIDLDNQINVLRENLNSI